jgi:hypothetical protein
MNEPAPTGGVPSSTTYALRPSPAVTTCGRRTPDTPPHPASPSGRASADWSHHWQLPCLNGPVVHGLCTHLRNRAGRSHHLRRRRLAGHPPTHPHVTVLPPGSDTRVEVIRVVWE